MVQSTSAFIRFAVAVSVRASSALFHGITPGYCCQKKHVPTAHVLQRDCTGPAQTSTEHSGAGSLSSPG